MNTSKLKRFATEARTKLRNGVIAKLRSLGVDPADNDKVKIAVLPRRVSGGAMWGDKNCSVEFCDAFLSLDENIKRYGYRHVVEEAAYTWFNRFMAIRILAMNQLCEPVLRFVGEAKTPVIVDEARQGKIPEMKAEKRQELEDLLDDDTKTTEQFAILITAFCWNTPLIRLCFGTVSDYTNILVPKDILSEGGFIDMMNSTDFISEEDYKSSELLGWLYQFYISERKDEVFAKKGKYETDDIAPATQIFTPNWIVKYMVQNAIGGVLGGKDALPENQRKYYVDTPEEPKAIVSDLEDLKVADFACGSGHILNECFDLLYELYINEGYSRKEAIENIFNKNLLGIDIDTRAKQLATFSLALKACQKLGEATLLSPDGTMLMPRIYGPEDAMPIPLSDDPQINKEIETANDLLGLFRTLGSIIKLDISARTRQWLKDQIAHTPTYSLLTNTYNLLLALTDHYDAIIMNPPYMPCNRIDDLGKYVNKHYPEGKADLFAVFMQVGMDRLRDGGNLGMINMQSWMFLSSYESLRKLFLKEYTISSMLHLGPRTFDELSGEVVQNTAFIIEKTGRGDTLVAQMTKEDKSVLPPSGTYYRLIDGKSCGDKERMFIANEGRFENVPQANFEKIPGSPIGYWISEKIIGIFSNSSFINYGKAVKGPDTGDDKQFLRYTWEVSYKLNYWKPYQKGGSFRKWYGNKFMVINWKYEGKDIEKLPGSRVQNKDYFFKQGFEWSRIASSNFGVRQMSKSLFGGASTAGFPKNIEDLPYYIGLYNTPIVYNLLQVINPTLVYQAGDINRIPVIFDNKSKSDISEIVNDCISISKSDWDAHETSWDFQGNEIVWAALGGAILLSPDVSVEDKSVLPPSSIESLTKRYKQKWERLFFKLHANEEELNRRFIEIYGLQDELTPDVPFEEITILQQGEIDHTKTKPEIVIDADSKEIVSCKLCWNDSVLIKQLLSYAIGCMMGRYRLDRPGLAIAHPNETKEDIAEYPLGRRTLLSSNDNPFFEKNKEIEQKLAGNLPHWHQQGKLQFVTFRLADSLPREKREELSKQKEFFMAAHPMPWDETTEKEFRKTFSHKIQQWLDNGYGACVLQDPKNADIVEKCLLHYDGEQYIIHGFVVMPNHVHVVVEILDGFELSDILKSWKGITARRINQRINKVGSLWMEESFDRLIRNRQHYDNVIEYIDKNIRQGGVRYWNGGSTGRGDTPVALYSGGQECPPSQYFWIDDDGIIPLMPEDCGFHDNAANRLATFVRQVFGEDSQAQNLNFIEQCLGKSIEQYFIKDFWKDHKKMYQNRPIYWLFASKNGSFQVLVYVHRMNVATVERIRSRYLLPYIERLNKRIEELEANEASLSTKESKRLAELRKQVDECTEYHNRLAVVAEKGIVPDLDDGIVANHAKYGDVVAKLK